MELAGYCCATAALAVSGSNRVRIARWMEFTGRIKINKNEYLRCVCREATIALSSRLHLRRSHEHTSLVQALLRAQERSEIHPQWLPMSRTWPVAVIASMCHVERGGNVAATLLVHYSTQVIRGCSCNAKEVRPNRNTDTRTNGVTSRSWFCICRCERSYARE